MDGGAGGRVDAGSLMDADNSSTAAALQELVVQVKYRSLCTTNAQIGAWKCNFISYRTD